MTQKRTKVRHKKATMKDVERWKKEKEMEK